MGIDDLSPRERADYVYDVVNLFLDYDALDCARKWIELIDDKSGKDYRETSARCYLLNQEYSQAEELYMQLVDQDPYSTYYWTQLTASQYLNGKISEALQSSEFALAIDSQCEDALLAKANCQFTLGQLADALDFYHATALCVPMTDM